MASFPARPSCLAPVGPGKTTHARQLIDIAKVNDCGPQDPISLARLDETLTAPGDLHGPVVMDQVQRRPRAHQPVSWVWATQGGAELALLVICAGGRALPWCGGLGTPHRVDGRTISGQVGEIPAGGSGRCPLRCV